MTDESMNAALEAALAKLPDTHFAILLVGEIPAFGQPAGGNLAISTSAGAVETQDIICRVAKSIEEKRGRAGQTPP